MFLLLVVGVFLLFGVVVVLGEVDLVDSLTSRTFQASSLSGRTRQEEAGGALLLRLPPPLAGLFGPVAALEDEEEEEARDPPREEREESTGVEIDLPVPPRLLDLPGVDSPLLLPPTPPTPPPRDTCAEEAGE